MISNPSQLSYTCIAKGNVVLAEFVSKEVPGIEDVALRCIENTPPHHSMFSHTVHKKTYTFAIDASFVYFAILDECMEKPESFWLLNRLRSVMEDLIRSGGSVAETLINNPSPRCLQSKLDPVFAEIVGAVDIDVDLELDIGLMGSPSSVARESRNLSIDSSKGRRASLMPLLGKPLKALKKKKRLYTEPEGEVVLDNVDTNQKETSEKKMDLCGNGKNGVSRKELRNGLLSDHHHHSQKAKQIWKKHVWVVLMFDFCICAVLFGIWLWICQGFQCING